MESLELAQFKPLDRPRPAGQARVESFEALPDGRLRVAGYALLGSDADRPADCVLLCRERAGTDHTGTSRTIFAIAEGGAAMPMHPYQYDLALVGRNQPDRREWCRWEKIFDRSLLPTGETVAITAWALNLARPRAYRIAGKWEIDPDGRLHVIEELEMLKQ